MSLGTFGNYRLRAAGAAIAVTLFLGGLPAHAQTTPIDAAPPAPTGSRSSWELIGGFEVDTHGTRYGFLGPVYLRRLNDNVKFTGHVYATTLNYAFSDGRGGETTVDAPGINPGIGLRFGDKNWFGIRAGLDIERRRQEYNPAGGRPSTSVRETRVGASVGADAWWNPTTRTNVHAMINHGTASDYTWGRIAVKRQVSNLDGTGSQTLHVGAEVIGQGNDDIRSWQLGGLIELAFPRHQLSLTARSGYKRSSFDAGPDKSGPYFGIGLWKRF